MQATTLEKGQHAEQLACDYLRKQGLKTLARNYRCRRGEIDLVMGHGQTLVFVEVRYRKQTRFGSGAESVTATKQAKLISTAKYYLQENPAYANRPARFDVVSITEQQPEPQIEWIPDAFQT